MMGMLGEVMDTRTFYTVEELAEMLKVSTQTIRAWIKSGKLKSFKIGKAHRIPDTEVQRLIAESNGQQG